MKINVEVDRTLISTPILIDPEQMSERKRFVRSLSRRALVQQIVYRSLYFQWSIKGVEMYAIRTHLEFRLRAPTINSLNAARINGDSARKRQLEVEGTFYFLHARDSKQKLITQRANIKLWKS